MADHKIGFYKTIKEIEGRLGDPNVVLDSFIVSSTRSNVLKKQWGLDKSAMQARHIVFPDEDKESYIGAVLRDVASA